MINIKIICVGKLKEKYLEDAMLEYTKRLSRFCNLEIIEINDEKLPNSLTHGNINNTKNKEAEAILSKLNNIKNTYVISLDEIGKPLSSSEFSDELSKISITNSSITFIIGGSLGLSNSIREYSSNIISFSRMTFPHQLFRIMLAEQLFRAFKISNNEHYHH